MSDEKVVRLHGGSAVFQPGTPDEIVVKLAEDLLERARAGEIVGVAIATEFHDGGTGDRRAGTLSRGVVGRLFSLMQRITGQLDG